MSLNNDCSKGDNICSYHREFGVLISRHDKEIDSLSTEQTKLKEGVSNLRGRINAFGVILSALLVVLCGFSCYGVVQINKMSKDYANIKSTIDLNTDRVKRMGEFIK
jgi:hypothetical protein